jgi:hypothetical protein
MPTPTIDSVTLLLSVSGGGDFGPFFAALTLDRSSVEWLLRCA